MSESDEDFLLLERGDFSSSSLNSNISDFSDENMGLSVPVDVNKLEFNVTSRRHKSSENTNAPSYSSEGSLASSVASGTSEYLSHINTLQGASKSKVLEYKALLEEVNNAHDECKISEFLIGCAKESSIKMVPQVRARVQSVLTNSAAQKHVKLRSSSGESFNILGLTDDQVQGLKEQSLSPLETFEFNKHMIETVKHRAKEIMKQKDLLTNSFRLCGQKQRLAEDTLLTDARKEHRQVLEVLSKQEVDGSNLLNYINDTIIQLAQVKEESGSELLELSFKLLHQKATFLSTFISKLIRHQVERKLYGDHKYNRALSDYGDHIKTLIEDTSYELNELKSSLAEYEKKQNISQKYEAIVLEYSKAKKHLQHSRQILSILCTDSPARASNKS